MRTLFGPHWQPYHRDGRDAETFRLWHPPAVLIVSNGLEVPYIEDVPPDAAIWVRLFEQSELWGQRGLITPTPAAAQRDIAMTDDELLAEYTGGQGSGRDLHQIHAYRTALTRALTATETPTPEQIAERQVAECVRAAAYLRAKGIDLNRVWWTGINEPMVWSIEPVEMLTRLELARMIGMERAGLNPILWNVGVGWFGNGGVKDAPVQWDHAKPVYDRMGKKVIWGSHEYWYLNGPQQNYRWWAGRYEQCPYRVPLGITECGIDCGVVPGEAGSGWLRLPEPSLRDRARHYIRDLEWYEDRMKADGRIVGGVIFTHDGVKEHWGGFNTKLPDWEEEFLAWQAGRPEIIQSWPERPVVVKPDPKPVDPLGDALKAAFGDKLVDLRGKLPSKGAYPTRSTATIRRIIVHHTAVTASTPWADIASYHVNTKGWAGIGYHIGISPDGKLYLLNGIDRISNHAFGHNADTIGIVFAGNFQTDDLRPGANFTYEKYVGIIEEYLGRELTILGHRDVGDTACPGNNLYDALFAAKPDNLEEVLFAAAMARDLYTVNVGAALRRAILADGRIPTSGEYTVTHNGIEYVCQVGRKPTDMAYVYWCERGVWDQVHKELSHA